MQDILEFFLFNSSIYKTTSKLDRKDVKIQLQCKALMLQVDALL